MWGSLCYPIRGQAIMVTSKLCVVYAVLMRALGGLK